MVSNFMAIFYQTWIHCNLINSSINHDKLPTYFVPPKKCFFFLYIKELRFHSIFKMSAYYMLTISNLKYYLNHGGKKSKILTMYRLFNLDFECTTWLRVRAIRYRLAITVGKYVDAVARKMSEIDQKIDVK